MPAGQWVAFEGYDQVHDCSSPSCSGKGYNPAQNQNSNSNPGFANFEIRSQPGIASYNSPTYSNNGFRNIAPSKATIGIPSWVWGLMGVIVLIILISRA
jgi:hypothetical protein